jgi:hypothetical protein
MERERERENDACAILLSWPLWSTCLRALLAMDTSIYFFCHRLPPGQAHGSVCYQTEYHRSVHFKIWHQGHEELLLTLTSLTLNELSLIFTS